MQTDKEAMWEFVRGASFTMLVLLIFLGFLTALGEFDPPPAEKFSVIDHYGTCAVIRYRPEGKAQDVYFLDCGNQHLD